MTAKQGVTIASRILTAYFLALAGLRLMDIPVAIMALMHYSSILKGPPDGYVATPSAVYFYRVEIESLSHSVLLIALTLMMALAFYHCGPKITQFLLPPIATEGSEPSDDAI